MQKDLEKAIQNSKKRKTKQFKPVDPNDSVEADYRIQLNSLIRLVAKEVKTELMPEIKRLKPEYQADSWIDDITRVIDNLVNRFTNQAMLEQFKRIARRTVSMQEAKSTASFVRSVNRAVGVDINYMMNQEGIQNLFELSVMENVDLIKSIPQKYFDDLRFIITDGMSKGYAPSKIAADIQKKTQATQKRAAFIARDQVAKINSDITRQRMKQTGAKLFRWSTSKDERVGSDHRKAANRITKYGKGIYTLKDGAPEGFPGNATRPNCRCTMILLIPGVNYFPNKKR